MVFIVVPAYNEEKNIGRVLRDLFSQGFQNVVVVDDGSSDNTYIEAKKLGVIVLRHEINRGQGAALQTGNEYVLSQGAEIIVHFDADRQFTASDIGSAIGKMKKDQVDVILGSRFLDNRSQDIPWSKKNVFLPLGRFFQNFFSGIKLTDVHNGFRLLSRRAAEQITISQSGMAHNSEIVEQIKRYDLRYMEYPVAVTYNEYGQGVGGGMKIIRDLIIDKFVK